VTTDDIPRYEVPMSTPRLFRTTWGRVTDGAVPRCHDLEETR
jgi:hypothetical protein